MQLRKGRAEADQKPDECGDLGASPSRNSPIREGITIGSTLAVTPTELVDLAGGVHHFLLTREERVAVRTDLNRQLILSIGGASDK